MGDRIKGITIELDGDITKLESALKKANSELKSSQNNLKDIDRLLKMDPGNTELLQQKYKTLGDAIGEAKDKLKILQDAQQQMKDAGKVGTEEYDALQREIVETEQKVKSLTEEYRNFGSVAAQQISAVGEKMQDVGDKISSVGSSLTKSVTLPLAAAGAAGVKNFAEVDKTMQLANKTMNNTEEEAERLSSAMKEAAANSIYGMSDAATATLNFARAGLNAEQAAAALAPAMNLAAGEGGNLDTVSAGLVGTINGFHGSFDDAAHYADVFAAACNNSALDVDGLSSSMSVAAPIFSAAGYRVEDAALAMGLMGNAGIEASVSANSLKTGIARLAAPAKDGATALEQLGFSTGEAEDNTEKLTKAQNKFEEKQLTLTAKQLKYQEVLKKYGERSSQAATAQAALVKAQHDLEQAQTAVNILTQEGAEGTSAYSALLVDENGDMRDFRDVVASLHDAFSGLSETEQIAAASAIFGKNQMTPWLALINTAPEGVEKLSSAINDCGDTTQEMAETMMGGFGGSIEQLKSSVDVLVYSFGEALAPTIQGIINFSQELVTAFNSMDEGTKQMIVKFALIAAAIGPILLVGGKLVSGIGTFLTIIPKIIGIVATVGGTLSKLWGIMLANPIVLIIAAVAALVAGFIYLWNKCEWFREFWINLWDSIKKIVTVAMMLIVEIIKAFIELITLPFRFIWENCKEYVFEAWEWIKEKVSAALAAISDVISKVWNSIVSFLAPIMGKIKDAISTGMGKAVETIEKILGKIKDTFKNIWDGVVGIVSGALDKIKSFMDFKWELPKLKLPHFSIDGEFSLNPPSIPHIAVDWYKKAMDDGMILTSPTIFGAAGGSFLGGGEAGPEAVVGVQSLREMIKEAVAAAGGYGGNITIPVYIGNRRLETVVVNALKNSNYQSGGH